SLLGMQRFNPHRSIQTPRIYPSLTRILTMTTATRRGTTSRARRSSRTEPSDVEEHDYRERTTDHSPAEQLRHRFTAVRLSLQWLGIRKTLSTDQRQQAAEPFAAQGESLSAAKKLLDTRHPAWKAVTAIRGQAVS